MPKRTIFFDIETIKSTIPPTRDEIKVPANYSKPETIEKYINENISEIWNKTALHPLKGQIICLAYAINDEPVNVLQGTEQEILTKFEEVVMEEAFVDWVGHNILQFDIPFVYYRAIKYGLKSLRNVIPSERFPKNVYDTMVMFSGTDYKSMYSLKDIAKFLGVESHKESTDGSMVQAMYDNGNFDEIYEYCQKDVELEREIFYRLSR